GFKKNYGLGELPVLAKEVAGKTLKVGDLLITRLHNDICVYVVTSTERTGIQAEGLVNHVHLHNLRGPPLEKVWGVAKAVELPTRDALSLAQAKNWWQWLGILWHEMGHVILGLPAGFLSVPIFSGRFAVTRTLAAAFSEGGVRRWRVILFL